MRTAMGAELTSADDVIASLRLAPHPERGYYRETFRDAGPDGGRGALTLIYFLLRAGERSRWHRVDAIETWHFYAGAPLVLSIEGADGRVVDHTLGSPVRLDVIGHERSAQGGYQAQAVVPAHAWQRARSTGTWSLVGCAVAPAFVFSGFELRDGVVESGEGAAVEAPPGVEPPAERAR